MRASYLRESKRRYRANQRRLTGRGRRSSGCLSVIITMSAFIAACVYALSFVF